jgi:bcr-type benzoyl-CoA reductase subunit C
MEARVSWTGLALEELVARAESLFRDYKLPAAAEWKKEHAGPVIGYMPIYVPRELLHAQGALPVAILGGGDDLEIIRGDAFYQSYICHIPRSTIELGLNGSLDVLDGMLFPAICDVIRNLSGIWTMKFPDKLVRYLDVPQNFDRDIGGAFYRRELEAFSEELVAHGARPRALRSASPRALARPHERALQRFARRLGGLGRRIHRASRNLSRAPRRRRDAKAHGSSSGRVHGLVL